MKKILIILSFLIANAYYASTGAYVGIGASGNILYGKQNLALSSNGTGPMALQYGLRGTAISAEILAGYGYVLSSLYLGAEGNYSFLNMKAKFGSKIGTHDESFTTKLGNGYGIAFRCGYIAGNSLIYLRMGLESRKISLNFEDPNNRFISVNKNYRSNAFVPGLGMETKLTKHLAFRLEGKGAFYPQKAFNINRDARNYTRIKTKPRLYNLSAAITYTF
jgi:hypothetical protein